MDNVNNKVSQILSQHKGVVSLLRSWYVYVAKKVKGPTTIFYMLKGICEDGVQP
jgi:hypothetical protein